jgi:predicted lipoprotein with Yx(FWY)xxD motif
MKRNVTAVACAVAALLVPVVSGCGGSDGGPSSGGPSATRSPSASASPGTSPSPVAESPAVPDKPVAAAQAVVTTRRAGGLGTILVDGKGRTLYLFDADTSAKPTCAGTCAAAWPPLVTAGSAKAAGGVKAGLLGTAKRSGGGNQVTYNKHPLYYYSDDHGKAGEIKGQNVDAFGARWYVVSPAGNKIEGGAH